MCDQFLGTTSQFKRVIDEINNQKPITKDVQHAHMYSIDTNSEQPQPHKNTTTTQHTNVR